MRTGLGLDRFSGLYLGAIFIAIFGIWRPDPFLTAGTLHSVAASYAVSAMLALAVVVPMASGSFDVSVAATANLATMVVVVLQVSAGWGMWPAIAATLAMGVLIGVVNGFVIVVLKVNSFIATLASATIIGAFQEIVVGDALPPPVTTNSWLALTATSVGGFDVIVLYVLGAGALIYWLLDHTPPGRYLYAMGGNLETARLAGVRVDRWQWFCFIISGVVAAIAGILFASYNGPSSTYGAGLLLPAFAAAFLGTTQVKPGFPNVWGTLIAVYVLAIGVTGMQLVTGQQWLNDMFNGVALIVAVAFAGWRQRSVSTHRMARRRPQQSPREMLSPSGTPRSHSTPASANDRPPSGDPVQ
jgi:ribose transport system permease protein